MTSSDTFTSPLILSDNDLRYYLPIILDIIESKDWATFKEIALQNPTVFRAVSNTLLARSDLNGMSLLHGIMMNDPPLEVVAIMIQICPDLPKTCDWLNRTPLHVATGVGASVVNIKYLAMCYPEACKVQDKDGSTPLHFACDAERRVFQDQVSRTGPPSYEAVHALLSASLAPASMEDYDEVSPIECAIFSNADIRVIKLLQKAAQKHMRKLNEMRRGSQQLE